MASKSAAKAAKKLSRSDTAPTSGVTPGAAAADEIAARDVPAAARDAPLSAKERQTLVESIVCSVVRSVDGLQLPVTINTYLDHRGLGHACSKRQRYLAPIRTALASSGCELVGLTPNAFCASAVVLVGDVVKLVRDHLQCAQASA